MKFALRAKHSLLFADVSLIGSTQAYFKKTLGVDYTFLNCLIREDDLFWNYDNDFLYNRALFKNKTFNQAIKKFILSMGKSADNLEKKTQKISKQKLKSDITSLRSQFVLYMQVYLSMMPFLFHYWNTERLLIEQLKIDLGFIFGEEAKETILQQILAPSRPNYFSLERQSLEKITRALFIHSSESVESRIDSHIKRFGFSSFVFHIGKPLNKLVIRERLQEIMKRNTEKKFFEQQKLQKRDKRQREKLLKQIRPFPEIYERVLLVQELLFWKHQRLDVLFKSDFQIQPLFERIAKEMNLSYQEFVYLRYQEIIDWFSTKKIPSKKVIHQRIKSYCLYLHNGHVFFSAVKTKYPPVPEEKNNIRQETYQFVQGQPVYPGKVTGKVRIIETSEEIQKVKPGEILVTTMTRPEMIVGLEKAAAFVTDQGGMLSHAAIVAREMKKPCIVGTKIATKVLHDGDPIEVDADKGLITLLA